jgi:glycine/D-amino acid oxidase-like deaminating enzyme
LTTPGFKDSLISFVSKLLKVSRRWFLKASAALGGWTAFAATPVFNNMPSTRQSKSAKSESKPGVIVVGAGAFGGWTALYLLRRGAQVTLIDAWGPGNSRASSGGETRIIRGTYGPNQPYTRMAARALQLWQENQKRWNRTLFRRMGVLWMIARDDDSYEKGSLPMLREAGMPYVEMNYNDLSRAYPQVNFDGVRWAIFEPESGGLMAREACAAVRDAFIAEGGTYRQLAVDPPEIRGGELQDLSFNNGNGRIASSRYVFACGPWLGNMFPDVIGEKIRPTRQEVFFFGTAGGDIRFNPEKMPIWVDHGERFFYGFPVIERRGFKIADDTRGPMFDPTNGQRVASAEGLASAREHLGLRFPMLKHAPLLESRVCQYENSPDQNFIMDRHPRAGNVWLLGGGSGHGFKHGPAVGEMAAEMVMTEKIPNPLFALGRFK